ncbi:MAG TPA: cupin domain-containing protein [Acidimicrobiia bacterium]
MNRNKFVALTWAAVSLAGVTAAIATEPSGKISRNELAVGNVTDKIDIQRSEPTDFHIHIVTIEPGGNSGWHTHPGPEYSVVKAGEIVLERAPNCDPITLKAGQGFFTPGGTVHMAHNDGKEPAEIYVTYTVPAGTTVLRGDADAQCAAEAESPGDTEPPDNTEPPEKTEPPKKSK